MPVDAGLAIDVDALAARAAQGCAGIVLANPNAPTGIGLPLADIERLLAACPDRVVLVDEAYVDFGGESALALIDQYPNLLVVQTMSKSRSLAGLRVGFACGQAPLVEGLTRVKDSFNSYPLDRPASAGAIASLADEAAFRESVGKVIAAREALVGQLRALGFEVLPSQANFVFARHPAHDGARLAAGLRERAVLVRHFKQERIAQYLRISVGTPAQCDALVVAMRGLVRWPGVARGWDSPPAMCEVREPGCAPGGALTFLLRQKSKQKRRPLLPVTPSGQPDFGPFGWGPHELACGSNTFGPDPPKRPKIRHGQKGIMGKPIASG
jgi:histidinol-phosphate aminotransferase